MEAVKVWQELKELSVKIAEDQVENVQQSIMSKFGKKLSEMRDQQKE